ncbi:CDP-glycerol glycerophosphotransferase family protein [Methanobacterium alcaliphilum]|uniref:CDP-glycerol glycerophosphotransferase family protein n=1 Tax=Methanobacterium alcaliphilum TaxID=392018 RepID=UPI00200AFFE8|nr:CDP-glycerol glycerophosphotransferase family protein [Methanobacterium alcaliphilum]MCK9152262.1 CDP-glycerol glycerophosphotransferase family protein [Methanobacterium alcaliphilum]
MNRNFKDFIKNYMILPGYSLFRKLPVINDLIIFESNMGRNYSGNPRYIYEEMVHQGLDKKMQCVWVFEDTSTEIPGNAKKIKRSRLNYYYYMARAKIWVFDTRDPKYIKKRDQGFYIQTWHGTPLKKLGMDMDDVFMAGSENIMEYKCNFYKDTKKWDFLLAQNEFSSQIFENAFAFSGKYSPLQDIWTYGYPRNDILTNKNNEGDINRLKSKLGIPEDKKVLLYAPTWRDNEFHDKSKYKFVTDMDFDLLQQELSEEYVIIVKYHYLVVEDVDWSDYEGFVYTFGALQDIAELYLVSDVLITDYSSVMFDYCILDRPMLFFMYDLETYRDELRGFYLNVLEEIPGPISKKTEDLIEDIKNHDSDEFKKKYDVFTQKFVKYDDGKSASRVVNRILELKDIDKVAKHQKMER